MIGPVLPARPLKPGEHFGEYVLADMLPPTYSPPREVPVPQIVTPLPPYQDPVQFGFGHFRFGSQSTPQPPQSQIGELPPKPGECLGEYAIGSELPHYPPPGTTPAATTAPRSALSRVAFWSADAAPTVAEAPPPRPAKEKLGRTWLPFAGPDELRIAFERSNGTFEEPTPAFEAAQWLNLLQGRTHRFRLTGLLAGKPDEALVATIEVARPTPATKTYLRHAGVVVRFRAEEAAQVGKRPVVKVLYLPDPSEQDFSTVTKVEEVVSTKLPAGTDPVAEAKRRGTVLAVIRLSNTDWEKRPAPRSKNR